MIPGRKGSSHTKLTLPLAQKTLKVCSSAAGSGLCAELAISSTSSVKRKTQPVALWQGPALHSEPLWEGATARRESAQWQTWIGLGQCSVTSKVTCLLHQEPYLLKTHTECFSTCYQWLVSVFEEALADYFRSLCLCL